MNLNFEQTWSNKLKWSLPWLVRYPFWRTGERLRRLTAEAGTRHLVFIIANHYEPSWCPQRGQLDSLSNQIKKVEQWCREARRTGAAVRDHDGAAFQHTNYFPGEQYAPELLEQLAELQADGFGEVEIHWHHGVKAPDNSANFRTELVAFRDLLAERHGCLGRFYDSPDTQPKYSFVHGNFALANSRGGFGCGVDDEMRILQETGCVSDLTLPSFPWSSQVPQINDIYECGHALDQPVPHRSGPSLQVGRQPSLPVLLTGPLVFDWARRKRGVPVPRVEDGVLTANCSFNRPRFDLWRNANIAVTGRPEWVFVKLYCHGFFPGDEDATVGATARRFWTDMLELAERSKEFKIYFASARAAFNMVMAAVDGHSGQPGQYRDYQIRQIMELAARPAQAPAISAAVARSAVALSC
jgi:hypothetical protein